MPTDTKYFVDEHKRAEAEEEKRQRDAKEEQIKGDALDALFGVEFHDAAQRS